MQTQNFGGLFYLKFHGQSIFENPHPPKVGFFGFFCKKNSLVAISNNAMYIRYPDAVVLVIPPHMGVDSASPFHGDHEYAHPDPVPPLWAKIIFFIHCAISIDVITPRESASPKFAYSAMAHVPRWQPPSEFDAIGSRILCRFQRCRAPSFSSRMKLVMMLFLRWPPLYH